MADLCSTAANFMQPFLLPTYTRLPYAHGSSATCQFLGFLFYAFLASAIYSAGLTYYFWTTVQQNRPSEKVSLEPWIHLLPWIVMTAVGILGISLDVIYPSLVLGVCLVDCPIDPITWECTRQSVVPQIVRLTAVAIAVGSAAAGIYYLCCLHRHVRRQEKINQQYDFRSRAMETNEDKRPRRTKRMKATMLQAICYSLAFLNSFVALIAAVIGKEVFYGRLGLRNQLLYFCAEIYVYAMFPLQGFLNWLVFIRPRLVQWKDAHPEKSYVWSLHRTLLGKSPPETTRTRHLARLTSTDRPGDQPREIVEMSAAESFSAEASSTL